MEIMGWVGLLLAIVNMVFMAINPNRFSAVAGWFVAALWFSTFLK